MSSSSAVHSNAFNFQSYVQSGVDPRTGQYTIALSLPEVKSHALAGPLLPLRLGFNPMNTRDGGFGLGWSMNLTEFSPQTGMLALGTGETFKVTGTDQAPVIEEQKLESFHFHPLGEDRYRVVHRTGLVEILRAETIDGQKLALPETLLGPDGRELTLDYQVFQGQRVLERVRQPDGVVLQIIRNDTADQVELLFYPGQGPDGKPMSRFVLELDGSHRVDRIVLPTVEQACWKIAYEVVRGIGCISEVWTPTGGHETIRYGERGDGGHAFPGPERPALPRVTTHVVDPGFEQPPMESRYSYTHNNFLGHGALDTWDDSGADNLYRVASVTFFYESTQQLWSEGQLRREIKRRYNRFHLMVEESVTQGNNRKRVATAYHADAEDNLYLPFKDQPPYCQMPMRITTYWEHVENSNAQRSEVTETWFDDDGNLTRQLNADGTREELTYYEIAGEPGLCPKDPEDFKRNLRSRTVYPAASTYGSAPTLRTEYRYTQFDPLPGNDHRPFLQEHWQSLGEEGKATLQLTETTYYNDPADTLQHGRPKDVTETMNSVATVTDYQYATLQSARAGAHVLQVIETVTGADGTHRSITQEHSLLNGEPLLVQDDNGVMIRYQYDALGRVTQETVAPDDEYEASRTYQYHLVGGTGDSRAWQLLSDVKQVHTRTWFDGVARAVEEERQDVDAADEAGRSREQAAYRATFSARYNGLGELISETEIDWLKVDTRTMVTGYAYDDWGERVSTTRPDKVVEWSVLDPISRPELPGPTRRSWLVDSGGKAGGVIETWLDAFDEPVRVERFTTGGTSISVEQQHRDGLGRLAEHIDARDLKTTYTYDAFDRVLTTLLPGNAVVTRSYALHSSEDLPESIDVNGVVLGTQKFDGLERRVDATTGGRKRTFHYEGGKARPSSVITPSNRTITYQYLEQLGEEIETRLLPDAEASYSYDRQNSQLTGCNEQGISLTREYYSNGEIKQETRLYADGSPDIVADYSYSLQGRLLDTSLLGSNQVNTYDAAGRMFRAQLGNTSTEFGYDSFGRVESMITTDLTDSSTLSITLEYDDFGRETLRTFNANGVQRTLEQTYYADDALATRILKEGGTTVRDEGFHYDVRGRLLRHTCAGTELPLDAYGKQITQQVFTSDAMDNLVRVITSWEGNNSDTATFHYEGDDPVQLTAITHTHPDYPTRIDLAYDEDGNLILDEQGRTLVYDVLGRLTEVKALGTQAAASYRFDALDVLAERSSGGRTERRYYVDGTLTARAEDGQLSHYLRADGHVLAEHITGTDAGTVLLATDRSNTVLGEVRPGAEQHAAYTAYGFPSRGPLWTELAYNGELHESGTGWQLLGNGYRAFNPVLQRFHSADDYSPFGRGGLNAYAYCGNNPVNLSDPSGHIPWGWAALAAGVGAASLAGSFAFEDNPTLKTAMQIVGTVLILAGAAMIPSALKGKTSSSKSSSDSTQKDAGWVEAARQMSTSPAPRVEKLKVVQLPNSPGPSAQSKATAPPTVRAIGELRVHGKYWEYNSNSWKKVSRAQVDKQWPQQTRIPKGLVAKPPRPPIGRQRNPLSDLIANARQAGSASNPAYDSVRANTVGGWVESQVPYVGGRTST